MNSRELLDRLDDRTEYQAEWYKANREKKNEQALNYYYSHKEEINRKRREQRAEEKKLRRNEKDEKEWHKEVFRILDEQRTMIGDASYFLLVKELNKLISGKVKKDGKRG